MRIAFVVDVNWALGRIATAVARAINANASEHGHHVDVYPGCGGASNSVPESTWATYDIIYVSEWDWKRTFEQAHWTVLHKYKSRMVFGAHSVLQFVSMDISQWSGDGVGYNHWMSAETVDAFLTLKTPMSKTLRQWFECNAPVVGAVSNQIVQALRCHLRNNHRVNVVPTHCGVDDGVVERHVQRLTEALSAAAAATTTTSLDGGPDDPKTILPLRVLIGTPPNRARHAYDAKRLWIVNRLRDMLSSEDIIIVGPENQLSLEQMDAWYDAQSETADVILCTSHSEGNPLSLIEGGGRGLIAVTTQVGISRELITHGKNGYIIPPGPDDKVVQDLADTLRQIRNMSATERLRMRYNMVTEIYKYWRWSVVAQEWLQFFMLAHYRLQQQQQQQHGIHAANATNGIEHQPTSLSDTPTFNKLCDNAVMWGSSTYSTFKQNADYTAVMGNMSTDIAKLYHAEYVRLASEPTPWQHVLKSERLLRECARSDSIGTPDNVQPYEFDTLDSRITLSVSPGVLRYMYQMAQIFVECGLPDMTTPASAWRVAEIGPAYGALCWNVFNAIGDRLKSYTAYELSPHARLMQRCLKQLTADHVDTQQRLVSWLTFVSPDNVEWSTSSPSSSPPPPTCSQKDVYDLVVSHYALSECTPQVIDMYVNTVIRGSKRGILTIHVLSLDQIDALTAKIAAVVPGTVSVVAEYPVTSLINRCIIWK